MIIKGAARGNAKWLADHLARTDTNEIAEVMEIRGVVSRTPLGAFREIAATALCTKARDALYHANIDPRADEAMTPAQWARAVDALEEKLGFAGQPRVVVRHLKEGREHVHAVWSRIDIDNRRAIPDSHNFRKHEEVARALEQEFGHQRVQGAHVEREGVERPARTPSRAEMQQAERTGIDPKAIKAEVSQLWQQTDSGKAFAAALEDAGYCLARGDKRDFVLIDQAGEVHSLARRVEGAKAKDIRERMADIDPAILPDAAAAKAIQAGRASARADQPGRDLAEVSAPPPVPLPEPERSAPQAAPAPAIEPAEIIPPVQAAPAFEAEREEPPAPAGPAQPEAAAEPAAAEERAGEPEARAAEPVSPPAESEAKAEPPSLVESVTAALVAQRRHLLDVLRRVWERRAVLTAPAREPEAEAPAVAVPAPDPEKLERRHKLLDAFHASRERTKEVESQGVKPVQPPEAAPVVPQAAPPPVATAEPAPVVMKVPDQSAPEVVAVPDPIQASAAQRQAAEAALAEAETAQKRRREAEQETEADEERRRRDPRIRYEEAQLVGQQARQDAAERKALQEQQSWEWRRLEQTEATRAQRDSIEEDQHARADAREDEARQPKGLFGKLKGLLSPAAARERQEEQRQIEAQRIRDHADRLAQRRERDAEARRMLTEAQARAKENAERAREARRTREREELRQRQRDREERERQREREARERGGRGGRDDDGGRDM